MTTLSKKGTALWAKKTSKNGYQYWLPLIVHLIDTQNVIGWLYEHWLSRQQQKFLTQNLSESEIKKLVRFLGFFHDFGKATPAFQTKESMNRDHAIDEKIIKRLQSRGFKKLNITNLVSSKDSPHALAGEAILETEFKVPQSVAAIIGGHHGKPAKNAPTKQISDYTKNYLQVEEDSKDTPQQRREKIQIQQGWRDTWGQLFSVGLTRSGYHDVTEIPCIDQPQAIILEGLLIMADWLASSEFLDDRQQIPLFPLIPINQSFEELSLTESKLNQRYLTAVKRWDRASRWIPHEVVLDGKQDPYLNRWQFSAWFIQTMITAAIGRMVDPGLIIIEAEMGIGKTETALLAAEQMAYKTGSRGLFMGLPTQATTNAMFERVLAWTKMLNTQDGAAPEIKVMAGMPLPDDDETLSRGAAEMFSGKESLLTDFVVGTVDQLLLMGLKQRHLFLRHLGLSGKVVIIDEVHAYDTYMSSYLIKSLEWLGAYQVPVIMLSATLPVAKRQEFVQAYLKGRYGSRRRLLKAPENWENNRAYPLLTMVDGLEIKQESKLSDSTQATTQVEIHRLDLDNEDLIDSVLTKIANGGIAGMIVNTVKHAQKLAELVMRRQKAGHDVQLIVLHAAFLGPDRIWQARKLQQAIGKGSKRPAKMIVIGTQILEQSLDIDFDVLYTDIAPIDLLLQRIGRLHRHLIARPTALQTPQVFITGIHGHQMYDSGSKLVYGQYLLMKTDHFLGASVTIPNDISLLIQQVYDPQTDTQIPEITDAKKEFEQNNAGEKRRSKTFQIDSPQLMFDDPIHGWLDWEDHSQSIYSTVRDIQQTVEVILIRRESTTNFLLNNHRIDTIEQLSPAAQRQIAAQTIRLPFAMTPDAGALVHVVKMLKKSMGKRFDEWQRSPWLRDAIVLQLDEQLTAHVAGWMLTYSAALGLSYRKEDEYDSCKV